MADDLGRQLADLLYGSEPTPESPQDQRRIAQLIDRERLRRLTGAAEVAGTLGSGLLSAIPAGYAALGTLMPTRAGSQGDLRQAAQRVQDVQGALTYLPRTETGQQYLEKTVGALEPLSVPAKYAGDIAQKYTGSPVVGGVAETLADPFNLVGTGIPTKMAKAGVQAAKAAPRVAGEVLSSALAGPPAGSRAAQRGAIKMKGGNWLAGEVEGATESLRQKVASPEDKQRIIDRIEASKQAGFAPDIDVQVLNSINTNEVLNNWIDKKLNRYIKNEMATPEDPVRKLAEQGVSHMQGLDQNEGYVGIGLKERRKAAGLPEQGFGESRLAKNWETKADQAIYPRSAGELSDPSQWFAESAPSFQKQLEANPWLAKISPETPVYERGATAENFDRMLGLDHLIDELKNSIRPDSDLPAHLRWKPEDLEKVTMEQAVKRVHDINEYRAAKKAEANEVLARNPATATFKEYPTVPGSDKPNEKGLAWKEIKMPEAVLPEGYTARHLPEVDMWGIYDPKGGAEGMGATEREAMGLFRRDERKKSLEEALKYEGDVMGHCVGGYCDDVLSGRSKIYSLRDKKGEPHVTIEVERMPRRGFGPGEGPKTQPEDQALRFEWLEEVKSGKIGDDVTFAEWWRSKNGIPEPGPEFQITQIKGKANKAPKDEYLPFVQDFVRSGNWSRVGDFQNTGLRDMERTPNLREWLRSKGIETPRYVTEQEYGKYEGDFVLDRLGKKEGGPVRISDNPDTMALELAIGGAVKGAKAAKEAAKAAEKAVPPKLPRAEPKTKAEIEAIAQRMAPQLTGEYVRKSPESAITVAGKTKKQFEREKDLPVELTGEAKAPAPVDIESLKGKAMMGILGDPSITGRELMSVGETRLASPAPQHGGPLYGMGREDEAFWASGKGAAQKVQNLADEISKQYGADVLGKYIMMGPEGLNYAQHFADANLQAIDLSKMTKKQVEQFDRMIRKGSPNSGPRPSFPGIEDKEGAYLHLAFDPELRKHFNALMQMPTVTEAFNLPSGQDIRFAITEPLLRDLERGVSGMSIGEMRPGRELTRSSHPTYEMDIPGKFLGSSKYPVPYELMFPDTVKAIRENPRQAPHEFGSLGMVGPRQIIDQQMIDELKAYEEQIRKLTGKKKGGAVKMQAGGAIKSMIKRVGDQFGSYEAKRLERAADEVKNLEKLYKEEALEKLFSGDNAKAIMTMRPEDFEKFSARLPFDPKAEKQFLFEPSYADQFPPNMTQEQYIRYLANVGGFQDIPFLSLNTTPPRKKPAPFVTGHEGRHRSRALVEAGQPTSIVQLFPDPMLRESMPRRYREDFISALNEELERTNRMVRPQREGADKKVRPLIQLPPAYKDGGSVKKGAKVKFTDNLDTMRLAVQKRK